MTASGTQNAASGGRLVYIPSMPRIARGVLLLAVIALLVPLSASADTTPTTPATPTTPTTTPVVPAAVAGHLRTSVAGAFRVGAKEVTVTGRSLLIEGIATPFVAGQLATVEIWQGRRHLKSETVKLLRSRDGTYGHFSIRFTSRSAGNLKITAVHAATPQQLRAVAKARMVDVVVPNAGPGFGARSFR